MLRASSDAVRREREVVLASSSQELLRDPPCDPHAAFGDVATVERRAGWGPPSGARHIPDSSMILLVPETRLELVSP